MPPVTRVKQWLAFVATTATVSCSFLTNFDGLSGTEEGATPPDARLDTEPQHDAAAGEASVADGAGLVADAGVTSAYLAAVLVDEPVAYYRLGEASGVIAQDVTGAHNGMYKGTVTLSAPGAIAGDLDTAARFDGTTGRIELGDVFDFVGRHPFSLEALVKRDAIPAGPPYREYYIFSKIASLGDGGEAGYHVWVNSSSELGADMCNGSCTSFTGVPAPPVGTYAHIVLGYDGVRLTTFIDGTQKSVVPFSLGLPDTTIGFVIGGPATYPEGYFGGVVDEVAIYDHALSSDRVFAHHRARLE